MTLLRIILILIIFIFLSALVLIIRAMQLPSRIRKAEEYLNIGDYQKASPIVKEILEKKKDYIPARYLRAKILIMQTQYLLAISELNEILSIPEFQKSVNELEIYYHLAELYNLTKQFPKEIDAYKKILTFNPNDLTANHRLGHALYKQNKYKEAKENLSKALAMDPTLVDTYIPLGISCFNTNDYENAEKHLLNSVKYSQSPAEARFYLGLIYKSRKDFETAIRMFENSQKDKRYYAQSLFRLGEIYFEREEYKKAIEVLEPGIGSIKNSEEEGLSYRYLLAESFEMENDINEAVHHWEQISKVNPNYRMTKIKLNDYKSILTNDSLQTLFNSSLDELQPLIVEIISSLNYNIVSKKQKSHNEYIYKAYNIKRTNEPPILIYFNRTTAEVTENQVIDFQKTLAQEKCKAGIFITTSKFSIRAKTAAASRMIELMDSDFLNKAIEKIKSKLENRS